jgi:hypothetical protein
VHRSFHTAFVNCGQMLVPGQGRGVESSRPTTQVPEAGSGHVQTSKLRWMATASRFGMRVVFIVVWTFAGHFIGCVANFDDKRDGFCLAANSHAASMSNCSARDGFGLKANLACRLRIMWISSTPDRIISAAFSDLNPSIGRMRRLILL